MAAAQPQMEISPEEVYFPTVRKYLKNNPGAPAPKLNCSICYLSLKPVPGRPKSEVANAGESGSGGSCGSGPEEEPENMVVTICGHIFGSKCLARVFIDQFQQIPNVEILEFTNYRCPLCKSDLSYEHHESYESENEMDIPIFGIDVHLQTRVPEDEVPLTVPESIVNRPVRSMDDESWGDAAWFEQVLKEPSGAQQIHPLELLKILEPFQEHNSLHALTWECGRMDAFLEEFKRLERERGA